MGQITTKLQILGSQTMIIDRIMANNTTDTKMKIIINQKIPLHHQGLALRKIAWVFCAWVILVTNILNWDQSGFA